MKNGKINVLFMQSQPWFHADSQIHASLMRHLDRERFGVHVACNPGASGNRSAAFSALSNIADLNVRATEFGPSINRGESSSKKPIIGQVARLPYDLGSLLAYVRHNGIDIVHCSEKPRDAFYGYWLARLSGAKLLIHLHVKVEDWISSLTQWAMQRADSLVGVSQFVVESSIAAGFPAATTTAIHNGLEVGEWENITSNNSIRAEFGLDDDELLLAAVGRIATYKGQARLLEALAQVKSMRPKFRLLIVGSEDPGAGNLDELLAMTARFGLQQHVHFTGFRKDVRQIIAACDIFTFPSFEEPFGMVFIEAMMLQKPVAAIASGGVPEIVAHDECGLLSVSDDSDRLARNIVALMDSRELREQFGCNGRRRVQRLFSVDQMTMHFENHYQTLLAL